MTRGMEVLPPPVITRTGQKKPPPPPPPSSKSSKAILPGPPLPPRNNSAGFPSPPSASTPSFPSSLAPALPPRTSSSYSRSSSEYTSSGASVSSSSSTSDSRPEVYRLRAPAWGQAELPSVEAWNKGGPEKHKRITDNEKRKGQQTAPKPSFSPQNLTGNVAAIRNQLADHKLISPATDRPSKPVKPAKPNLPPRTNSTPLPQTNQYRNPQDYQPQLERVDSAPVTRRKIPPPPPRGEELQKIRQTSFATLSGNSDGTTDGGALLESGISARAKNMLRIPPPIPHASRPSLPAIPTSSKPRITPTAHSDRSLVPLPATSATCLKCRDFSAPDAHAALFPRQSLPSTNLAWLSAQLTSPFPSLTDKARVIFKWLHHNVIYDVENFFLGKCMPQSPEHVITSGFAVCAGFAALFETLASHAGLEVRVLSGHGAGFGHIQYPPGAPLPPYNGNHAWNAVRLDDGRWKLIDACWGAGYITGRNMPYSQVFSPKHFIMSNDEFGLSHYPEDKSGLYREDGRTDITWEEYIGGTLGAQMGLPTERPTVFSNGVEDHGIGEFSLQPVDKSISIAHVSGRPVHFQFGLICEHWSVTKHGGKSAAALFLLATHGVDGREDKNVPFHHVRGTYPGGGGDYWHLDIADGRVLGCPGQTLVIYELTSFGHKQDVRGITTAEYERGVGRVGMGFRSVAEWCLV